MKKILMFVLLATAMAWAATVTCPLHYDAPCYFTGQVKSVNGQYFELYRCSCGDQYWVTQ